MIDKFARCSQADRVSIRAILLQEWDPIGIIAVGGPDHEYDMYIEYIEGICALLTSPTRSQEEIAARLLDIQSRRMLCASRQLRSSAATGRRDP